MIGTPEEVLKMMIGDLTVQKGILENQLEMALARIKELEEEKAKSD